MLRGTWRESRGATDFGLHAFHACTAKTFNPVKQRRYDEDGDRTGSHHASDHGRSHDLARYGAGPGGTPKRHTTQNESEGSHQDGAQTQPGAFERGFRKGVAFLVTGLCKLHDEDGVLGRESDQHDQPDLGVHVIFEAKPGIVLEDKQVDDSADQQSRESAEDGDRHTEQYAKGKRPTFIERCEDQEGKKDRQAENSEWRNALRRFLLLKGHAHVVKAHPGRHRLGINLLERMHGLLVTESSRRGGINLRGSVEVIAHGEFGSVGGLDGGHSRQGHHVPLHISNVKLAHILGPCPVGAFGLGIDLPLASEAVEVVDKRATHKGLQGCVNVLQLHALGQHLVAVDVCKYLRHRREGSGENARYFRSFLRRLHKGLRLRREELHIAAAAVLEDERHSARCTHAWDRRRWKCDDNRFGLLRENLIQVNDQIHVLLFLGFALVPRLESHPKECAVGILNAAQQAVANHGSDMCDARCLQQYFFHSLCGRLRSLQRGGVGQLLVDENIALVFVGQKRDR